MRDSPEIELNKLAAEFIISAEQSLNRELTNLEKVAVFGMIAKGVTAAGKYAYKGAIKPFLSAPSQANVSNWSNTIKRTWNPGGVMGPNPALKMRASNTVKNAFKASPGLTTGALVGTGAIAGAGAMNVLGPNEQARKYPPMPVYAAIAETIEELEKIGAKNDKEKESFFSAKNISIAGAGALGGLILGIRNKRIINKAKEEVLLEGTKNLRNAGTIAANKYKEFSAKKEDEFDALFNSIADVKKRSIVKNTTKDVEKAINEAARNIPRSEAGNKSIISKEFHDIIDSAHEAGEIPAEVSRYLKNSVNTKFRENKSSSPIGKLKNNARNMSSIISSGEVGTVPRRNNYIANSGGVRNEVPW